MGARLMRRAHQKKSHFSKLKKWRMMIGGAGIKSPTKHCEQERRKRVLSACGNIKSKSRKGIKINANCII
jgi:hypothetical protein